MASASADYTVLGGDGLAAEELPTETAPVPE